MRRPADFATRPLHPRAGSALRRTQERWFPMPRRGTAFLAVLAAITVAATACNSSPAKPVSAPPPTVESSSAAPAPQNKYFVQADFDRQMAQRRIAPQGDPKTPWLQMIQPSMVDTAKYAKPGKWH